MKRGGIEGEGLEGVFDQNVLYTCMNTKQKFLKFDYYNPPYEVRLEVPHPALDIL